MYVDYDINMKKFFPPGRDGISLMTSYFEDDRVDCNRSIPSSPQGTRFIVERREEQPEDCLHVTTNNNVNNVFDSHNQPDFQLPTGASATLMVCSSPMSPTFSSDGMNEDDDDDRDAMLFGNNNNNSPDNGDHVPISQLCVENDSVDDSRTYDTSTKKFADDAMNVQSLELQDTRKISSSSRDLLGPHDIPPPDSPGDDDSCGSSHSALSAKADFLPRNGPCTPSVPPSPTRESPPLLIQHRQTPIEIDSDVPGDDTNDAPTATKKKTTNTKKKNKPGFVYPPTCFRRRSKKNKKKKQMQKQPASGEIVNAKSKTAPSSSTKKVNFRKSPVLSTNSANAPDEGGPSNKEKIIRPNTPPISSSSSSSSSSHRPNPTVGSSNYSHIERNDDDDDMEDFQHKCNVLQLLPGSTESRQHFRAINLPRYMRMIRCNGAALVFNPDEPHLLRDIASALADYYDKIARAGKGKCLR